MATALPSTGKLVLPIMWQATTTKSTMETGSFQLSTTIGTMPFVRMGQLVWVFDNMTDAQAHIAIFEGDMMNGLYEYDCPMQGTIVLRPTGSYSWSEVGPASPVEVMLEMRRVK